MTFAGIPRLNFGHFPTPLEELLRLRADLGGARAVPRLLIKRDDYSGPGFGGNKVRKLEYVLAKAVADGVETAITVGGLRSNHARITAAMCSRLGIETFLVLNGTIDPLKLRPSSIALEELYGAKVHLVASRDDRVPAMESIAHREEMRGKRVVQIPLGASTPLGALGYIRAATELKAQLTDLKTSVDYIFHASSSGGTQAGLIAGCRLAGLETRIIGVSPDEPKQEIESEVRHILKGLGEFIGDSPAIKEIEAAQVEVLDDFIGPGYGIPSSEGTEALQLLARTEGIVLDEVYTTKAMAALISWIQKNRFKEDETVLFWHTGGQLAMFYVE
jgi:1-aminocyclopropane-1-carboxylate deaminase/D-cysteine desulfhydrase-like pyridoxal-dependent ACC family enzyme